MSIGKVFAIGVVAVSLRACINYGGAESIKPLDVQLARSAFVENIVVTTASGVDGAHLEAPMLQNFRRELDRCAVGNDPLNLEVTITEYEAQNVAETILIGGGTKLKGIAKLLDPISGAVVGDYDFAESSGGGGILAAAGMSGTSLTREAAESFCEVAFKS